MSKKNLEIQLQDKFHAKQVYDKQLKTHHLQLLMLRLW